jgi:methionine--tRNA ligase beta chain
MMPSLSDPQVINLICVRSRIIVAYYGYLSTPGKVPISYVIITLMTIDEFQKSDLRVGKIVSAERVEGSEKLLKLQVDIAEPESRQILSGIAKQYAPDDLVGKSVVIIANLEPRMMMGTESNGMLLAAHGEDGSPVIIQPVSDVPPGAKIS